ncbi:MAG: glutamate 5-kinase [Kiritimatiellaeota bacterium]|nr:glutamate 5-kinase [Kiritimatiellota bacterium]
MQDNLKLRKEFIGGARTIVVKVGTRLLPDDESVSRIVAQLEPLVASGKRVMLVSSGAVGMGMRILSLKKRSAKLADIQALAALGQSRLMSIYERNCAERGFHAAQLLLTSDDLRDKKRYLNVLNCVNALWKQGNLPVINENDSVSIDELKFGDNDKLAALLAVMARADLTILLTTVDGLRAVNGKGELDARVPLVKSISRKMMASATGTDDDAMSVGGMSTKLEAAKMVMSAGEPMIIADGRRDDIVKRILDCEDVGTLFVPTSAKRMSGRKRWLGFFSDAAGALVVDAGAVRALSIKGKSLLPSGILKVTREFQRGDVVDILNEDGEAVARGLVNYSSTDLVKIAGMKSREFHCLIGSGDDEAVHRGNMTLY